MKNKKNNEMKIIFIIAVVVLIAAFGALIWMTPEPPVSNQTQHNTIQLFADENYFDPYNLKRIHFADIYVNASGELNLIVLNSVAANITRLQNNLDEIRQMDALNLTVEPELGLLQGVQVAKNDSLYIYAVSEYLRMNGFQNEVK